MTKIPCLVYHSIFDSGASEFGVLVVSLRTEGEEKMEKLAVAYNQ